MTDVIYTKHFRDLNFTVTACPQSHWVEYVIYDIEGFEEGTIKGVFDVPLWHKAGADCYPDPVTTLEESEAYISGSVKWDGCSNWTIDENDRGTALHGCCRKDIQRIGDIMAQCWDWTAELIPDTWYGE